MERLWHSYNIFVFFVDMSTNLFFFKVDFVDKITSSCPRKVSVVRWFLGRSKIVLKRCSIKNLSILR